MTNRRAVPSVFAALLATALALSPAATAGLASGGADTRMSLSISHFGGFRSVVGRLANGVTNGVRAPALRNRQKAAVERFGLKMDSPRNGLEPVRKSGRCQNA
jgi:hypothetical protein